MANYVPGDFRTYTPAADLTGKTGYCVMISSTGGDPVKSIRLCTDAKRFIGVVFIEGQGLGAPALGLTNIGRYATIQEGGTAKCVAAAAIGQGANVTVNTADGRVKAATTGEAVIGIAEEPAANPNDVISVRLHSQAAVV